MALGFVVILIGVPHFGYRERRLTAWQSDPPWFDGWELARDSRMRGNGYPLVGLFSPDEVRKLHERFAQRVRDDGSIIPTEMDTCIISEDNGSILLTGMPRPPTVMELDELLTDPGLGWIIIELWDRS